MHSKLNVWFNQLAVEVREGLKLVHIVPLITLYEHEKNLNAGRFMHFKEDQQTHLVKLTINRRKKDEFDYKIQEWIDWVATHTDSNWNIAFDFPDQHRDAIFNTPIDQQIAITFSFENLTTAVVFKLVWF